MGFVMKLMGFVRKISKLSSGMPLYFAPPRFARGRKIIKEIQATLMWEGILNTQTERAGMGI